MTPTSPTRSRFLRWLPWRRSVAGWLAAVAIAVMGVPLFLRMPLWCDATLYDMAARNVLNGGVHYRDVFDTNPPGFVWLVCVVRSLLGWSSEAMRAADLLVLAGIIVVLLRLAKAAGADSAGAAWTAAAIAGFYLFTSEFSHVQRDVWMMLPAVGAVLLRVKRIERMRTANVSDGRVFRGAVLEAAVWGLGFWVKPHIGLIAAVVWLISAPRLAFSSKRWLRRLAADVAGQLVGLGLIVGAGVAWLVGTGAWPYYLDVNRQWNTGYWDIIRTEQPVRDEMRFGYFPPWTDCLRFALPLAALNLLNSMLPWRRADDPRRLARALLGVILIVWFAIGLYLQRPFMYVHVPEVLLMFAVFAANRWAVAFWLVLLRVVAGVFLVYVADYPQLWAWHSDTYRDYVVYRHLMNETAAFDRERTRQWRGCFDREVPRELRLRVALESELLGGVDPVQLGEVEDFLRNEGVKDGELLCWHDNTHPLYLSLNVRPPIRFMHVGTAMDMGIWQRRQVAEETRAAMPGVKFSVSDLHRLTWYRGEQLALDNTGLPGFLPAWQRVQFPFDQPMIFRSSGGRYLVHRIVNPVRECEIPGFDQPEPFPWWQPPPGWQPQPKWKGRWRDPD